MWIDATSGAGFIYDKTTSQVADKTAFAPAPIAKVPNGSHWFWAWALAIPKTSKQEATAKSFLQWATSKEYIDLVGKTDGWTVVPPGTRQSTYDNPDYLKAAPFAKEVENAILTADLTKPTRRARCPIPASSMSSIPEFQAIGTTVGQLVAAALTGQISVDEALKRAQSEVSSTMQQAGYSGSNRCRRRPAQRRPDRAARRGSSERQMLPLIAPAVGLLLIWSIVPLAMTLWFSFRRYNLLNPMLHGWAGGANYRYLFQDPTLYSALLVTVIMVCAVLVITIALGAIFAALFANDFPGQSVARVLMISPFFVMPTVSALIWKNLLMNPVNGLIS